MAKKVVGREMTSRVGLDSAEAVKSLKHLTAEVKANTSGWKAQETALKSAGEYQKAAAARVDGLAKSMEAQKAKIDELKKRQSGLNRDTKDGEEQYLKLTDQINKASRSYDSMGGQLDRAKSKLQYYNSGLADLQKGYKQSTALSESYVKRLEAEGKSAEANKARLGGLKQAYSNMEAQYKAQTSELERIKTASGATSDAYKRQQVRVNETATSMAKLKSETNELNPSPIKRLSRSFSGLNKEGKETHSIFKNVFAANIVSSAFTSTLGAISTKLHDMWSKSMEYAKAQQTMNASWLTLTGNAKEGKKMVNMTNDMAASFANSTDMVNDLNQKFYSISNSSKTTKQLTTDVLTLQDAFGKSDDEVKNFSTQYSQMMANGKVSAQDMMSFVNVFPKIRTELLKTEQKISGNHNLSMKQLNDMISNGKVSSKTMQKVMDNMQKKYSGATANFGKTIDGMNRTVDARVPALLSAFTTPILKMRNPFLDTISKWVSDPKTEKSFGKLGKTASKGLNTITNAFTKALNPKGGFNSGKIFKTVSSTITSLANVIAKHAKQIVGFFKGLWSSIKIIGSIGAGFFKGLISGLGAVVKPLAKMTGHSKAVKGLSGALGELSKHKKGLQTLGKVLAGVFITSKALKFASAITKVGGGMGLLKKSYTPLQLLGKGLNLVKSAFAKLTAVMIANPFVAIAAAVIGVSVALYELYKHNKKFRKFVNGIAKAVSNFTKNAFKGIKKFFSNMGKGFSSFGKSFKKSWNKHWSAMGKSLKSAWNGSLKHTRKFFSSVGKKWNGWKKSFKKSWSKHWSATSKSLRNNWNGSLKHTREFFSSVGKKWNGWKSSFRKSWSKHWNSTKSGLHNAWNGSYKHTKHFFSNMGTKWTGWKKSFNKSWNSHWNKMRSNLHSYWNKDLSHTRVFGKSMGGWLSTFKGKFKGGWSSLGTGVENIFKGLWKNLKKFARDGMNNVIDIINDGIKAVDAVIHSFGSKNKRTIPTLDHVKFAEGTGIFSGSRNPITKPTMAMLNDGNDSPQTGNKEMVMLPNGESGIVQGRNTKMMLPAGTEVLSASETAMLMAMQGVTKYAKGTGFFGDILNSVTSGISGVTSWVGKKVKGLEKFFNTAENIIAHPIKSLENLFSWSSKGISGVMSKIGHGLFKGVEKQAKTWWSTLWGGVSDSLDNGGSSSKLVNAMMKYGATNKYVYGAEGPSAFDCSGLVEYTLKKLGIDFPRTSGEQYRASKHVSHPKPGDLVFFGPGGSEHVGVYTGNGEFYSAENEKDGMGISKVHGGGYGSFAGYGRVPGLSDSADSSKSSKSSGLLGTIKKQVGSGFWKFISKLADEFGDGGSSNPGGSGVQRWKPDVIKALKKNGFEASASQVSAWMKVIARESNGNPTVVNHWDRNAQMGIPSMGLVQTIRPTFEAYKFPGHNNPLNGYDDLLAGIHYMKAKYGSGPSAFARVSGPEGYENGGIINTNQLIEVAEHNKPEMVLPLTNKSRANQLIAQASQVVNGNNGSQIASNSSESSEKLDKVIALLTALVSGQGNVQAVIAKSDVVNAVKSNNKTASQYSQMMGY